MDKRKIIIVEPDKEESGKLQTALTHAGFEVDVFRNGDEAYKACINKQPSLVLSELFLPVMNGVQLFHKLRTNYSTQHITFVVMAHEKQREERIKSMQLGVDDYINKPFYVEEVIARIEMLLTETEVVEETRRSLEHGFSGSLSEMNLVDLIQTLEVGDKSAVLRLSRNGQEGVVYVDHGQVFDVSMDALEPNHALESMLTWIDGNFMVEIQPVSRDRMINFTNKEIFEYGTKKIHEWRQIANQLPQLDGILRLAQGEGENALAEEEKSVALMFKDGAGIRKAVETNKMDDLQFLRIVKRLLDRKLLIEAGAEEEFRDQGNFFQLGNDIQNRSDEERHGLYSRISSFFNKDKNRENGEGIERRKNERRQNNDRREGERRRNGTTRRVNKIYLTKDELLLIRQKLL